MEFGEDFPKEYFLCKEHCNRENLDKLTAPKKKKEPEKK